ncbi:TonB-dependent receptor plug domain-containing protein [Marinoscillum pacificum]|uniref:TonB-dependent receptor plug domain-containing protein n=1 Tax=Marinoscillum pacificum TaxID=392723 RepID=UPI0021584528|nr:TonB-dependent receptor [Marinoscillum pacificum]
MKHIISMWMLLGALTAAFSQTVIITDETTFKPVEMVILMSDAPKAYATTNIKGQADISGFANAQTIQIYAYGYESQSLSFQALVQNDFKIQLKQTNINLEEIVIAASRWTQSSGKVPSKLTDVSPKDIAFQNPQTAADLLGISGKVFIQKSQQGGGSPMIRGFATNRLLYTVDGVRMNTAIFRGGNLQNVINMDPFTVENAEVLFGPGSVIYGSDAIGGVMSFQTLTPQLSLDDEPIINGKAVTRYSSANDEKTGHFDINFGWKKWGFATSFSSWDYDHLRQGSNGPEEYLKPYYVQRIDSIDRVITQDDPLLQIPTAYMQQNLMQKIRFQPNANWNLEYGFHYSETSSYGRYDRHNRVRNGTARYAEWNYGPQKWMMNNLSISNYTSNALYDQMTIRLALQQFEESRIDRSLNGSTRSIREEKVNAYSLNTDLVKAITTHNTLYYGIEYVLNDVKSSGIDENISAGTEETGPSRYPAATWQSMALYVNDEHQITQKTTLQAGLRYNQYLLDATFDTRFYPFPFETASLNNGALTGSLGAVYRPNTSTVLRINFGTAFRSPNVDDIGKVFDSEPGSVVVPNPDLEAEYAYNLDIGIAKVISDRIKVDVTAYKTILSNALVRRDFTLNGQDSIQYNGEMSKVQAIQNAARTDVYGLQFGVNLKMFNGFSFNSDLNIQHGEEELDDGTVSNSRHAAPWFGVSRVTYEYEQLKLQLYAQYQGERIHEDLAQEEKEKDEIYAKDHDGETYAPAWYTLNIKGQFQLSKILMLTAGMENLTDQRYRPYSSGVSGAGRNFILSLTAKF